MLKYHKKFDAAETDYVSVSENPIEDSRFARLKKSVVAAGGNAIVAARARIGTSTLSGYMNNSEWKIGIAEKIADACGVSLSWLLFGVNATTNTGQAAVEDPSNIPSQFSSDAVDLRYYNMRASTNFRAAAEVEAKPNQFVMSRRFLQDALDLDPDRLFLLKVASDSMAPEIMPRDTLLVDTTHNNDLFGVHVMLLGGHMTVKRLALKTTGVITISCDNPVYPSEDVAVSDVKWFSEKSSNSLQILGRVVYKFQALL